LTGRFGESFGEILDRQRGIAPAFDFLRLFLAVVILFFHARWLCQGDAVPPISPYINPLLIMVLPMFFALGGFLVMGSADRVKFTSTFVAFRALRILPALCVEVLLSAFFLGSIFTTLPLSRYFTDWQFFRYFANMLGFITFQLPGVFENNPVPDIVNLNLWMLPLEIYSYAIIAGLMWSKILLRLDILTYVIVIVGIFCAILNGFTFFAVAPRALRGYTLTYYFFVGMLFYHWRHRIPRNWGLFAISSLLAYLFMFSPHAVYLAAPFITYSTIFMGMMPMPKLKIISKGDYSYGMYLYGFPILQALVSSVPALHGHVLTTFLAGISVTFLFAVCSWHLIEKPALAQKNKLPARWFPVPSKAIVPMPEQRAQEGEAPVSQEYVSVQGLTEEGPGKKL
jgi:peptidoglycan/LPS O-acetylase OafA/YrhL